MTLRRGSEGALPSATELQPFRLGRTGGPGFCMCLACNVDEASCRVLPAAGPSEASELLKSPEKPGLSKPDHAKHIQVFNPGPPIGPRYAKHVPAVHRGRTPGPHIGDATSTSGGAHRREGGGIVAEDHWWTKVDSTDIQGLPGQGDSGLRIDYNPPCRLRAPVAMARSA